MVEMAGLPAGVLERSDLRVSATAVIALLRSSAKISGREDFGLLVADAFKVSTLGALGLLLREQPSVGDALATYARYANYTGDTLSMWVEPAGEDVVLHPVLFETPPDHDDFGLIQSKSIKRDRLKHSEPDASGKPLRTFAHPAREREVVAIDVVMGDTMKILRSLLGADWRPRRACFTRRAPADPGPYQRRFGRVEFEQAFDGLVLARADLTTPIATADPDMTHEAVRNGEGWNDAAASSFAGQVTRLIAELTACGACTIEHVATRLNVDRRTIHRRLAAEGQSFTGLVEKRRRALVAEQLSQGGRSLTEVASVLGFSTLSSFSRWYRQVYGGTARQWRAARGGAYPNDPARDHMKSQTIF